MPSEKSPILEMAMTVQFAEPAPVTVFEVSDLASLYRERYPIASAQELSPPMLFPGDTHEVLVGGASIPRLWFVTSNQECLVQVQADRFTRNWRRLAPASEPSRYPGYEVLKADFFEEWSKLRDWYRDRNLGVRPANMAELLYLNTIPLANFGRLSDILAFFQPTRKTPVFLPHFAWSEEFATEYRGVASVDAKIGQTADGVPSLVVNLVAKFALSGADETQWAARFDAAHQSVIELLPHIFSQEVLSQFGR